MYPHERSLVESLSSRPFVLLGVNNDEEKSTAQDAVKTNNLNWRSWWDGGDGPIVKKFGITGFPTIFLVDHTGVIRYKNLRGRHLETAIENLVSLAERDGMTGGASSLALREFSDMSGKHKVKARYHEFRDNGMVVLKGEKDNEITIPWGKLSLVDRQYISRKRFQASGLNKLAASNFEIDFDTLHDFADSSGKHSMQAVYVAMHETNVIFWKANGVEVKVPWKKLSKESQEFVKQENKRRRNAAEVQTNAGRDSDAD
jgi:hypothetical protein